MLKTFSSVWILVLSVLYYYYHLYGFPDIIFGSTGEVNFHYNLNFDLLNRTVSTLDQDNPNHNLNHTLFRPVESDRKYFEFNHGVASGDPLTNAIILWTRITPQDYKEDDGNLDILYDLIPVQFEVVNEHQNETVVKGWTWTSQAIDFTVKVDITGLLPNSTYFYQFHNKNNGPSSQLGETRTLPDADSNLLEKVRLAIYSCSNYAGGYYHAYKFPILKESIDYVVHLGDYIYEYSKEEYVDGTSIGRTHEPIHECYSLQDYRIRYASYRRDKDLQASHAKYPWILVWDDHEVTDNAYHSGSVHSKGYEFITRKDVATQAYFEWLPIRPQKNLNKIWRNFKFGKLFTLNMLDTRNYDRDLTDIYDNQELIDILKHYEHRSILGFDQEKWLENELLGSDTTWNFISSQCVVNSLNLTLPQTGGIGFPFESFNQDSWDGYIANRNRLLQFIKSNKLNNTVVLSGDFHIAIASELHLQSSEEGEDSEKYDIETGLGSLAVEFTTSAVSSPSTFPREYDEDQCLLLSRELVSENDMIWNEGYWRGYYELSVGKEQIDVKYFGVDVQKQKVDEEHLLAEFSVKKNQNHIDRNSISSYRGALNEALHR